MRYTSLEMKYIVFCFTLNLLFLANIVSSAYNITISYDDASNKVVSLNNSAELHVTCKVSSDDQSTFNVTWARGEEDVHQVARFKDRLKTTLDNGVATLRIKGFKDEDAGNFSCIVTSKEKKEQSEQFNVYTNPQILFLKDNTHVVEGEKLQINCTVEGYPTPEVYWVVGNETYYQSRGRVQLMEDRNVPNSLLIIEPAEMNDREYYKCVAYSNYTKKQAEVTTLVRVKDKLAALWPFLGICAEVFVLCAIILVYEKKRNKTEMEDSDTDQSPDQKNTPDHGKDSDVRHRK